MDNELRNNLLNAFQEIEDHIDGKITLKTTTIETPKNLSAERIAGIRKSLKLSQSVFAKLLNVSPETEKAWEQGKREPSGPSLKLLNIAEKHPEIILEGLG